MSDAEQTAQEAAAEFMRTVPVQDVVVSLVQTVFDVGYRRTGLLGGGGDERDLDQTRARGRDRPRARAGARAGARSTVADRVADQALSELQLAYAEALEGPAQAPAAEPGEEPQHAPEPEPPRTGPRSGPRSGHRGRRMSSAEIGVFGGSGFYSFLDDAEEVAVDTPYGPTSDRFAIGDVGGKRVAFLPRHGRHHHLPPHADPVPGQPVGDARAGRAPGDRPVRVGQPVTATCRRARSSSATSSSTAPAAAATRSTTAR